MRGNPPRKQGDLGEAMQCNEIPPEMQIMNMCSPQKKGPHLLFGDTVRTVAKRLVAWAVS